MAAGLPLLMQLFIDGVWTTYAGYGEAGFTVTAGPDVETGTKPNSIKFRFADPTRQLDPYNPASALYGKIGRNTKCRIAISGATITQAEVSDWLPDETAGWSGPQSRGIAWMDITAEGLLRRLGRWTDPIRSAMTRSALGYGTALAGLWTFEDPSTATALSSEVAGTRSAQYTGTVNFAQDNGAGGSDKVITLGSDAVISSYFKQAGANGWQVSWAMKLPAVPGSATVLPLATFTDTTGRTWVWGVNNTTYSWVVTASDGTVLSSVAAAFTTPNQWIRYRLKVSVSGSTVTYEPAWYVMDGSSQAGVTNTFAGTLTGQPRQWTIAGNTYTAGAAAALLFGVGNATADLLSTDSISAFNGYLYETAAYRYNRLMVEEGFTGYIDGLTTTSVPMGRQKPGIFLDLLTQCAATEGGLLFDEPLDVALTLRTRAALTNQTPFLTLTKQQLVAPLGRRTNDVGIINSVTLTNLDGTSASSELAAGNLSVQPPPAGIGRYRGGSDLDLNVADTGRGLADRADWELNKGTIDRPRYEQVTVDLFAFPSLRASVVLFRPGKIIMVTGVEPDAVYLRALSMQRDGNHTRDQVTFNCVPADMFIVARSDTATDLADSATSALAAGATAVATVLQLTTLDPRDTWSATNAYDIMIAGERVGVPAGGMSAAAGTGPYTQTLTGAVRSKNNIVKAQLSGAAVHIAGAVRSGL